MTTDSPSIHVLMGRVLAELPAIGKDQQNTQQNFKFRGIDQVLNALNPLLSKHGVVIVPHAILDKTCDVRTTKAGGVLYTTYLTVQYRWYGPNGDYIETVGVGEGTDSGDKATPKAMTGAYKYMIFEALSISTAEASSVDADRHSPDETLHPTMAAFLQRYKELPPDLQDRFDEKITKANDGHPVPIANLPEPWWGMVDTLLTKAEEARANRLREAQDADATTPQDVPTPTPVAAPAPPPDTATPVEDIPPAAPTTDEPASEPPPTESEEDPTFEPPADFVMPTADDELEWEVVMLMDADQLKTLLYGDPPTGYGAMDDGKRHDLTYLRRMVWLAAGGQFEDDKPTTTYVCPYCLTKIPGKGSAAQDALFVHMETEHAGAEDLEEDDSAESGEAPNAPDVEENTDPLGNVLDEPISPNTLALVREEMAKLTGAAARAYAEYRRTKGLPANAQNWNEQQAIELIEFLDALPSAS